jgi:hypothetical protein
MTYNPNKQLGSSPEQYLEAELCKRAAPFVVMLVVSVILTALVAFWG